MVDLTVTGRSANLDVKDGSDMEKDSFSQAKTRTWKQSGGSGISK